MHNPAARSAKVRAIEKIVKLRHKNMAQAAVYYDQHLTRVIFALVVITTISIFLYGTFYLKRLRMRQRARRQSAKYAPLRKS